MGTGRDVDAKDNGFKVILKSHLNFYTHAISRDCFMTLMPKYFRNINKPINKFVYRKQFQLYKVFELIVRHTKQRSRQEN